MEWFKKHADALMVIGSIIASMVWMNGKFNQIDKDMAVMETIILMKEMAPAEVFAAKADSK